MGTGIENTIGRQHGIHPSLEECATMHELELMQFVQVLHRKPPSSKLDAIEPQVLLVITN